MLGHSSTLTYHCFLGKCWTIGLPKIFRVSFIKPQTTDWTKMWGCTKFQVSLWTLNHVCIASKTSDGGLSIGKVLVFGTTQTWINNPGGTKKLGTPSHFHRIFSLGFEEWDPKNSGQNYCTCVSANTIWLVLKRIEYLFLATSWSNRQNCP